MFLLTQFIGLYVVNFYSAQENKLPLGMDQSEVPHTTKEYYGVFSSIVVAFIFAIILFFLLSRFHISFVLKLWFFLVIVIALTISFKAIFLKNFLLYSLIFALFFAFFKVYKNNFFIHNFTELLIYPGIAAVFVPLLNIWTIILLLILISLYDMWAVWHSGIMQKMAKYQMNTLKIFSGFFLPYASKKQKAKIKALRTLSPSKRKNKKIKVQVAILGGGDVVFPIITAGVMLVSFGLSYALFVTAGATLGLAGLFFLAEKKKFYPAMPFITAGIFLGMLLSWLIL